MPVTAREYGMRKCRNWQTSKTKDLVTFVSCGFKSHLPHAKLLFYCFSVRQGFFMSKISSFYEQDSGRCKETGGWSIQVGGKSVRDD